MRNEEHGITLDETGHDANHESTHLKGHIWGTFLICPEIKNPPCNARDASSVPGWGTNILQAM